MVFHSRDLPGRDEEGNEFPPQRVERAVKDLVVPKRLPLKVGAQVMLVKVSGTAPRWMSACLTLRRLQNIIQGVLVNGSVGRIVGFYKPREALAMGIDIALPDPRERSGPDVPDIGGGPQVEVPQTPAGPTQNTQREEKIKQILQMNSVWPAVQFQNGVTQLCVPLTFEVVSAEGTTEVIRHQVRALAACITGLRVDEADVREGALDPSMGTQHSQVARPDSGARAGRPEQDLREGSR